MNDGTFDALTLAQIRRELQQLVAMADTTGRPKPDVVNPAGHAMPGREWRIAQDVPVDRHRPPLWLVRTVDDPETRDCLYVAQPDPYRVHDWLQALDFTAMTSTDARRLAMALLAAADRVDEQAVGVPSLVDRRHTNAADAHPGRCDRPLHRPTGRPRRSHPAMTTPLHPTDGPVQDHFGLTYANYLVLPRTLLQSMPIEWQTGFVHHLDRLAEAFRHVPQAEAYEVVPGAEHLVGELSAADLKATGHSVDWYGGETPPAGMAGEELDAWQAEHEKDEPTYYDRNFNEIDSQTRVLVPGTDPVPHYNRGRTYIEPLPTGTGPTTEGDHR